MNAFIVKLQTSVLMGLCFIGFTGHAQDCTDSNLSAQEQFARTQNRIFNANVHKVVLKLHRETAERVLDNANRGVANAPFGHVKEFCFFQNLSDQSPEFCSYNAAYRVRGNNSRTRLKRQFRVRLNLGDSKKVFERNDRAWVPADLSCQKKQNFLGLTSLNLRSGGIDTNDHSMAREAISSGIITNFGKGVLRGGPVYRVAHAQLYMAYCEGEEVMASDCRRYEYKGLYQLSEEIDEKFIKNRFQNGTAPAVGALISTAYANFDRRADFQINHFHELAYEPEFFNLSSQVWRKALSQEALECEKLGSVSNSSLKDKSALVLTCATLKRLEKIISSKNHAELGELFDLPNLYSYMASVNFLGHWDSLMSNANNDFLFFNPNIASKFGGKWQVLVWDLDNTIGANAPEQISADHLSSNVREKNLLFDFLLTDATTRLAYESHYREIMANFRSGELHAQLDRMENRIISTVRGSWEENVGIDYPAAFRYVRDFLKERERRVRLSLSK